MFAQLRRQAVRQVTQRCPKRTFGGHSNKHDNHAHGAKEHGHGDHHHDDHGHHVEYMSTHSELPHGDWRDKPMHWDFNKVPTTGYEKFIHERLSGPDDPLLKLTKGQFIVHMRRLQREEYGYQVYTQRLGFACCVVIFSAATNKFYKENDVVNKTFEQISYDTMFEQPLLTGDTYKFNPIPMRLRLDEFFADHDEATLAKLPKAIRDVYEQNREQYNDTYASQGPIFPDMTHTRPDKVKKLKSAIMKQYNLTEHEINAIILTCDPIALSKEVLGVDTIEEIEAKVPNFQQFLQTRASLAQAAFEKQTKKLNFNLKHHPDRVAKRLTKLQERVKNGAPAGFPQKVGVQQQNH